MAFLMIFGGSEVGSPENSSDPPWTSCCSSWLQNEAVSMPQIPFAQRNGLELFGNHFPNNGRINRTFQILKIKRIGSNLSDIFKISAFASDST